MSSPTVTDEPTCRSQRVPQSGLLSLRDHGYGTVPAAPCCCLAKDPGCCWGGQAVAAISPRMRSRPDGEPRWLTGPGKVAVCTEYPNLLSLEAAPGLGQRGRVASGHDLRAIGQ
jgi:hypothetical protein